MTKIQAVFFDLDGTLVRYEGVDFESSWGAIGAAAGLKQNWDALLAKYLGHPDRYPDWMKENAALLRGIEVAKVAEKIFPPPYAPGVRETMAELKAVGRKLGIISSGVALVADRVREELGMDFAIANELLIQDGRFTGEAVLRVDLWNKLQIVQDCAKKLSLSLAQVAFVGDHLNDIPVLRAVGCGIAYAPKARAVARAARFVTDDFRKIPDLIVN